MGGRWWPLVARDAAGCAVRAAGVSAAGVSVSLIFPDSAAAAQHARARFAGPTGRALNHKPFLPARPLCRAFVLWSQHIDSFPRGDAFVVLERARLAGWGLRLPIHRYLVGGRRVPLSHTHAPVMNNLSNLPQSPAFPGRAF